MAGGDLDAGEREAELGRRLEGGGEVLGGEGGTGPNGSTVGRNIKVAAPPILASEARMTWASLASSIPPASAMRWPS